MGKVLETCGEFVNFVNIVSLKNFVTMIHFIRIIHPIGQGGFCSETFKGDDGNEVNIIYDCGGKSGKFMSNYLSMWKKGAVIDAVFISHLHSDHINGLKYLLDNYTVKRLILPELTEDIKCEVLLYNMAISKCSNALSQFTVYLLSDNRSYKDTEIIRVPTSDADTNNIVDWNFEYVRENESELSFKKVDGNDSRFYFNCGNWLYIPWNPKIDTSAGLYNKIKIELNAGHDFSMADLPRIIKDKINKCKVLYDGYFPNGHNSYSMTLFSGLNDCHYSPEYCHCMPECCHCICKYHRMVCPCPNYLHTGDYEPEYECCQIKKFYGRLWSHTPAIQVPHHGSKNNFDCELYKNRLFGFISCGMSNKFKHPHHNTILGITDAGCHPVIITENINSIEVYNYKM